MAATLLEVTTRRRELGRAPGPPPRLRRFVEVAAVLLVSAVVEELVFRVALLTLLVSLAPPSTAVICAATLFALPHVIRGASPRERLASVVTSFAFGVLLGVVWIRSRSFGAIVGFHFGFNLAAGVFLGGGALDPLSRRLGETPTWPFRQRYGPRSDESSIVAGVLAELGPLAVIGSVLLCFVGR